MKYKIYFDNQGGGVYALHNTIESAQSHINMLVEMFPKNTYWEIVHEGKVVKCFPEKKRKVV